MTSKLNKAIAEIKGATFGIFLIVTFFSMVFFSIAYFFSSWYFPLRLAQTGEMTSVVVISKDKRSLIGRNGPFGLMEVAKVQDHKKEFSVIPSLYDSLLLTVLSDTSIP